jgi:mannose-6-phosphate isomerase-like protein (cupin superfamily)
VKHIWWAVLLSAFAFPSNSQAQQVDRISAENIRAGAARSQLTKLRGSLPVYSRDGQVQYLYNRRDQPSEIEMHCAWDDLFFVQSGHGEIETSATLRKRIRVGMGEWRAERTGTKRVSALAPGDVVRVPAGVGHAIVVVGDAPLVYLVVKVKSARTDVCEPEGKAAPERPGAAVRGPEVP